MKKLIKVSLLVLAISFLYKCSEYERVFKGKDYDAKYDMALNMYQKKKFLKAQPLFEEAISVFSKLTEKGERAYYYLSYCHYNLGAYPSAAYYFKSYTRTFPRSKHAEECAFMAAMCKVNQSPKASLDQTPSSKAIDELMLFMTRYPESSRKDTCNIIIDGLRDKMENKAINLAKLYYQMEDYKAAKIALATILDDYPDTDYREEIFYLLAKSNFLLAKNSVEVKKKERFEQTIKSIATFVDNFPGSSKKSELSALQEQTLKELDKGGF